MYSLVWFIWWLVDLQVIEDELRERIERLETRQATDDASLLILNRYWNQVNKNDLLDINRLLSCKDHRVDM